MVTGFLVFCGDNSSQTPCIVQTEENMILMGRIDVELSRDRKKNRDTTGIF